MSAQLSLYPLAACGGIVEYPSNVTTLFQISCFLNLSIHDMRTSGISLMRFVSCIRPRNTSVCASRAVGVEPYKYPTFSWATRSLVVPFLSAISIILAQKALVLASLSASAFGAWIEACNSCRLPKMSVDVSRCTWCKRRSNSPKLYLSWRKRDRCL